MVCGPERAATGRRVAEALGDRAAGVLAEARMHVPIEVADRARDRARELGADSCVAVGGGSAIGLGKAIALAHGLPVIAVPTTYAGSEMTPIWGLTQDGRKRTGRDPRVLPVSVIYDPELTRSLPVDLSVTSGMNAVAHAVEALLRPGREPDHLADGRGGGARADRCTAGLVISGGRSRRPHPGPVRGLAVRGVPGCDDHVGAPQALPRARRNPGPAARADPHRGAAARAGVNQQAVPQAVAALSRALGGTADPARRLWDLATELGAPRSLRGLGMAEADIPRIVQQVLAQPYANPVPVTAAGLTRLLRRPGR